MQSIYQRRLKRSYKMNKEIQVYQTVTKKFTADYAHHLPKYHGKCANPHGHTALIEVTFRAPEDYRPYPGIIIDFGDIKTYCKGIIDHYIDHKDLNGFEELLNDKDAQSIFNIVIPGTEEVELTVDGPKAIPDTGEKVWSTTAENIVRFLAAKIMQTPIGDGLVHIRFHETPTSWTDLHILEDDVIDVTTREDI
jgi:6-pyruvoyltetrahydropterin/6-carboxytetrahydropterin synthase